MAAVCFAYLSDLPALDRGHAIMDYFPWCRWFTRGWTLQELIAAKNLEFYDQNWNLKGDKTSLRQHLSDITNIDIEVLENSDLISTIPVAKRMSWAAERHTKRVEDISYCLFGLFDVNLPLIYGEGSKAFIRLQEAIAAENNDMSLFAWTSQGSDEALRGLFARSPSEFHECGSLCRVPDPLGPGTEFALTNRGVRINTHLSRGQGGYRMNLHCRHSFQHDVTLLGIHLLRTAHGYLRERSNELASYSYADPRATEENAVYIPKIISTTESHALSLGLSRRFAINVINVSSFTCDVQKRPEHLWDEYTNTFITEGNERFSGVLDITVVGKREDPKGSGLWRLSSRYALVFGLGKRAVGAKSEENKGRDIPRPWVSIYSYDGKDEISRTLSDEHEHGFPNVLTGVSEDLRRRASSGTMSRSDLSTPLNWHRATNKGHQKLLDKYYMLCLHASTVVRENRGSDPIMYEVIFKIERESRTNVK